MMRLGLLGHGISYSLSPRIFEWAFRKAGIPGQYDLVDLAPEQLESFLKNDLQTYRGLNVTIPYKQAAYRICRELSSAARRSGVVNALSCDVHGTIAGHNTDVGGLQIVLSEMADAMPYDSVLIVGGGGAARAAIVATQFRFPQARITLAARSRLAEIKQDFPNIHIKNLSEHDPDLSAYSLIIQCTPVGGTVQTGMPLSGELKFRPGATVLDLIYAPRETEFLRCARKQGAITTNGLTMLLGQALQAFQWWTGAALPLHAARAELIPQLTEL